jgi:hypothetical protein
LDRLLADAAMFAGVDRRQSPRQLAHLIKRGALPADMKRMLLFSVASLLFDAQTA